VASQLTQDFPALLGRHRLVAGLSQEALAERAGLSVRGHTQSASAAPRARVGVPTSVSEVAARTYQAAGLIERQPFLDRLDA
jgi:hypothetical protein